MIYKSLMVGEVQITIYAKSRPFSLLSAIFTKRYEEKKFPTYERNFPLYALNRYHHKTQINVLPVQMSFIFTVML